MAETVVTYADKIVAAKGESDSGGDAGDDDDGN